MSEFKRIFNMSAFAYYLSPLLMSSSIKIIIDGYIFRWSMGIAHTGIQARFIGLVLLFVSFSCFYSLSIEIPSRINKLYSTSEILKILLSPIFDVFLVSVILIKLTGNDFTFRFLYCNLLIICLFVQMSNIARLKKYLFEEM